VLLYRCDVDTRGRYVLVQSQDDSVGLAEDIKKTGWSSLLHFLCDTLLARRRDVRGLDVDWDAGLGGCVGGHDVFVMLYLLVEWSVIETLSNEMAVSGKRSPKRGQGILGVWLPKKGSEVVDATCCSL
jgi:hypothetical protein